MLHLLREYWQVVAGFSFGFIIYFYQTWKAAAFIKRAQDTSLIAGFRKIIFVYSSVRSLAFPVPMVRGRRIKAARYAVELDILLPEETPGISRQEKKARKQRRKEILQANLSTEPQGKLAWVLEQFGIAPSAPRPSEPVIVKDFPALDDNRDAIGRYFKVIKDDDIEEKPRFLTPVTIATGYIAPLFLVTGLLNRFSQKEGWALIMDNYRQLVEKDGKRCSPELLELKSFLFNCWLLWGPSITHCSCDMWRAKTPETTPKPSRRWFRAKWQPKATNATPEPEGAFLLQYGYGDENNAIDVLMKPSKKQDLVGDISLLLGKRETEKLAIPYSVTGLFSWGPDLTNNLLPPVQALISGTEDPGDKDNIAVREKGSPNYLSPYSRDKEYKKRSPSEGRVILDCRDQGHYRTDEKGSAKYYTAYIWIMFVMLGPDGKPLFDVNEQSSEGQHRWKNILVYFEHANIADASTLKTLKHNLVTKTCSSLREILARDSDRHLKFRYICAVDDPFCDSGGKVFGNAEHGSSLVGMLAAHASSDPGMESVRKAMEPNGRLIVPLPGDTPELVHAKRDAAAGYSSCHIPGIVDDFYYDLNLEEKSSA